MKRIMLAAAVVGLHLLSFTTSHAQCSRGGGGGRTNSGSFSPIGTSTAFGTTSGLSSPLGSLTTLSASANSNFLAAQYRSQLAQQQNLIARQQQQLQWMLQRQQALESQIEELRSGKTITSNDPIAKKDTRRERLREQNADRAFEMAVSAEKEGRSTVAQSNYRRVVRILGADSDLGSRASSRLAKLTDENSNNKTLLASKIH